jgi:hypothetical protein
MRLDRIAKGGVLLYSPHPTWMDQPASIRRAVVLAPGRWKRDLMAGYREVRAGERGGGILVDLYGGDRFDTLVKSYTLVPQRHLRGTWRATWSLVRAAQDMARLKLQQEQAALTDRIVALVDRADLVGVAARRTWSNPDGVQIAMSVDDFARLLDLAGVRQLPAE